MALTLANRLSLPAFIGRQPHWLAITPEARNSLWYGDWIKGQFALNGSPVGFSQLGTFTASGTRYEKQASGPLTPRGVNIPRLADYSTGARRWLMEGAVTNLILRSQEFSSAPWSTPTNTSITNNVALAPDGTMTAERWSTTGAPYPSVFQTVTVANSTAHTLSVYAKAGTLDRLSLEFRGSGTTPNAIFDLSAGTVVSGSGVISPAGNGWYRCAITVTSIDTSELVIIGAYNQSGAPAGNFYIWGAQLEVGSYPTSYVATTGGTSTRAPDLFTSDMSEYGLGFDTGCWVSAEGVLSAATGTSDRVLQLDDGGDNSHSSYIYYDQAAGALRMRTVSAFSQQFSASIPYTLGTPFRVAAKYESGDFAFVVDGDRITGSGSGAFPSANTLRVASDATAVSIPASLSFSKLWIAPASAYTVADMEALTS